MSTPQQQRVTELLTALFDYDEKNLSSFSNSVQRANELEYPIPGERGMQLENMRFILSNRDSLLESVPQASEQMLTYMEKDLLSTLQYVGYTTANPYMIENLRSMTASDEQTTYLYFNAMLKEEALRRLDENRAELETIRKSYCDELDAQRWARLRETRARYDSLEDKIIEIADDNTKLEPIDESTPERFAKTWAAHKDGIARLDAVKQERSNIVRSMPEITYLPRNYQRKENEQLTSKLSKGFEWVSVAQEQVRQSILDDTMNLWEITPVVVSVLERMKPNARELAAIERKMESDRKRKKRFKIGTMALSTAATIACFFLSGGAATALQLAARAGAVTVATAGGIVMGVDELANALETERMVYASMYGKEDGAFTDEDIVSAKNGTRATAFYFALDIFGAFEAIQAWKMLAKYNALIPPVQDGIASLKNGKKVLETLSPEQLSGLSQLPSNDPIYPLLDTMKNGRINGVSVDEYIAIRQRANQGVINQLNNREVLDVLNFRKPSESIFTGDLRGEKITLKEVSVEEITYIKKERTELILLRKEFDTNIRKQFLINLVEQKGDDFFRKAGFSETDILKLKNGRLPDGWQVHHKLALDDGGTNDYDNLLLIQNEPYHKVITNYQNHKAKNLTPGQSKKVDWPIPLGSVYPKSH